MAAIKEGVNRRPMVIMQPAPAHVFARAGSQTDASRSGVPYKGGVHRMRRCLAFMVENTPFTAYTV